MIVFFSWVASLPDNNVVCFTRHEPIGVCGAITPVSMGLFCHRLVLPTTTTLTEYRLGAWGFVPKGAHDLGCSAKGTVNSSRVVRSGLLLWDGESFNWSWRIGKFDQLRRGLCKPWDLPGQRHELAASLEGSRGRLVNGSLG